MVWVGYRGSRMGPRIVRGVVVTAFAGLEPDVAERGGGWEVRRAGVA